MDATKIADNMRELSRIAVRVALIERSHLGEFSWPFTDVIRQFASKLFEEEELFGAQGPIVHVIAEGTGYQVVDDPASRFGTRRILVVAFPRQLKHHVLIHAIFGHELGHPAARTDTTGAVAQDVLRACEVGPLKDAETAKEWLNSTDAPDAVKSELKRLLGNTPISGELRDWRTEIFCDLYGLHLFGPAFAAAHRAELEPASGWPQKIDLSSSTHPPYPIRRNIIAAAMRLRGWNSPQTTPDDGEVHNSEVSMLEYAAGAFPDEWLTVFSDGELSSILAEFDRIFAPYPGLSYQVPSRLVVKRLVEKLTLGRPPILDSISASGVAAQHDVPIQHCLYAGWCEWFGRAALRNERLEAHPRLKELTFFEINRLCEMGLLQQQAIDRAAAWRAKSGSAEASSESAPTIQAANVQSSGALGRSALIQRLRSGDLYVGPILSSDQVGASSIDLRMGNVVLVVRARGSSHVDPARFMRDMGATDHTREIRLQQRLERYELKFETPFLLHPGTLALVPTLEWVSLPADLMGSVTARSTWAREGLSIATATMIEPGYQGIVTLELANLGEIPIALYPGLQLAQITLFDVVGSTERPKKGQFELSFEPQQGTVAKPSEYCFLPNSPTS